MKWKILWGQHVVKLLDAVEISSISPFKSYCPWQFSVTQCSTGVDVLTGRAEHNSRHCILIRHSATRCKNYQRGMSAGCKHLLVMCLLGFLPGKGPLWRIFSLPSISTTSIWIFPYNLFQGEYRGCESTKRDWDSSEHSVSLRTGFFPPFPLVNWKPPSSGGNVWYETVVKMSLQHFSSSELCPPGPKIPAQRDAGFFAFLSYVKHFFRDFFQHLVHNTLQKNRGEIQVYHKTPPESLVSPTKRDLTSVNVRHSSWHRQCIVHSQGMNSIIRESVSISCCNQQCFKGSIQSPCSSTDFVAAAHSRCWAPWDSNGQW